MTRRLQQKAIRKFMKFCKRDQDKGYHYHQIDPSGEQDWFSLSLGFFAALGLTDDEAHEAAMHVRYDKHYWEAITK